MRGKYYIWTSGISEKEYRVHFWVGNDNYLMRNSGWAEQFKEDQIMGAALPEEVFDELVVMRYAELQEDGTVDKLRSALCVNMVEMLGVTPFVKSIANQLPLSGWRSSVLSR